MDAPERCGFRIPVAGRQELAAGNLYHSEDPQYKGAERLFVRLLDISTGPQKEIPLPYQPWEVKLAPAKALLAFGNRVDAWVQSVSCSPDNRYFATGLYDSTILIWDLR